MLDWLIVGGGVHGVHLSVMLTTRGGVAKDRIRIVDPHASLMNRWNHCTTNVGMRFLRSPIVHHIDVHPLSLERFAKSPRARSLRAFAWPYRRPALALFREHCAMVIEQHRLDLLHLRTHATGIHTCDGGFAIETAEGALATRRLVLATGMGDQPFWPEWASALRASHASIRHVFDDDASMQPLKGQSGVVIVGGGISAAQTAMALGTQDQPAQLLMRHEPRVHQFDSDPGWIGPKFMTGFHSVDSPDARRAMIQGARHRGSMPPDVASLLQRAVRDGRVVVHRGEIQSAVVDGADSVLTMNDGVQIRARHVVLATGFQRVRPGGAWLQRAIETLGLRCASCGFPIVEPSLQWSRRLFVSGPLAELEMGPTSRNIIGARLAAERIVQAA